MKKLFVLFTSVLCISAWASAADHKSLGKFTLAPGEKKTVSFDATTETKVGYDTDISIDIAKTCAHNCVKMWVVGNEAMTIASAMGSSMAATPAKGKIEVVFENVEKFPIPIDTFRE